MKNCLEDVANIDVDIELVVRGIHERKVHRQSVEKVVGKGHTAAVEPLLRLEMLEIVDIAVEAFERHGRIEMSEEIEIGKEVALSSETDRGESRLVVVRCRETIELLMGREVSSWSAESSLVDEDSVAIRSSTAEHLTESETLVEHLIELETRIETEEELEVVKPLVFQAVKRMSLFQIVLRKTANGNAGLVDSTSLAEELAVESVVAPKDAGI